MRHIMLAATIFTLSFSINFLALGEERKKEETKKEDMVCAKNEEVESVLTEKGYDILLKMTNKDGVVEYLWTAGQQIVIVATVPNQDKSCLIATMKDVTYNPKQIEEIWETYKKQTKQKDI